MIVSLENITNVRDLGGMKGADGKCIAPKRLIRSSALYNLSKNDFKCLTEEFNIKNVVDLRSTAERDEKPNDFQNYDGVNYYHFASFHKFQEAVTRDKRSLYMLLTNTEGMSVEKAISIIDDFYDYLTTIDTMQEALKNFFGVILNCNEGSTIWHCSLGKDRAGIAAYLIEYVLGVSYEDMLEDYLATNDSLDPDIDIDKNNAFRVFYGVRESFLQSWLKSIDKNYGSLEKYMKSELKVGEAEVAQLRKMYLE